MIGAKAARPMRSPLRIHELRQPSQTLANKRETGGASSLETSDDLFAHAAAKRKNEKDGTAFYQLAADEWRLCRFGSENRVDEAVGGVLLSDCRSLRAGRQKSLGRKRADRGKLRGLGRRNDGIAKQARGRASDR